MSEEVLGIIKVVRLGMLPSVIIENLIFTSDRVIVARLSTQSYTAWSPTDLGLLFGSVQAIGNIIQAAQAEKREKEHVKTYLESILKEDKRNYAIPNSEIEKVELKKSWGSYKLHITTRKKKHEWSIYLKDLKNQAKAVILEDCENVLRSAFGDKLSVKK